MDKETILKIIKKSDLRPPVSIEYLNELEKNFSIQFPEEFKIFYSEISNGLNISNGRNLHSIETIVKKIEQAKELSGIDFIQQKFTLANAYMWETPQYEEEYAEDEYEDEEDDEYNELSRNALFGNIEIIDMGCGETWKLIVNGNFYGTVWNESEYGIAPCNPKLTFFEWFELWYFRKDIPLDFSGSAWDK